ncbi:MAG: hypothetical protein FWC26_15155 [Fibromonadales bacterium]|nr:hypothetical protein [Fibromonadales bacterium]
MKFNIAFEEKCAIALHEKMISKIIVLLNQYYPNVNTSISATLNNKNSVQFNDLKELLTYDNSGDYRIETLNIDSGCKNNFSIKFKSSMSIFLAYSSTVSVSFCMETKDDCVTFKARLKEIFREIRLPFYYTILSKISSASTFLPAMALCWLYLYIQPNVAKNSSISLPTFTLIILIIISAIAFISGIGRIWSTLFLPIHFLWGDEVIRLEKIAKIRSNVFWVVIIGIIVGIVAAIFSRYIIG